MWEDADLLGLEAQTESIGCGRSRFFCLTAGTDCVYGLWGPFRIARLDMSGHNEVVCRTKTGPPDYGLRLDPWQEVCGAMGRSWSVEEGHRAG
ncbi:hypothetical protein Pmar_PMAR002447 [Perkinsus marinus ATCC 50983]|uniref:Uncharacterized protein n=1 Tax=Perkinsus marinus (strain ATCC 50983 / TXsc) TaxID=423536 RepID=C5LXQ7_PERM5|nr:hypothetical protein Pmar_PMAR002447 [Perkinsus marinus ATCC 50983]EEQ98481.1 hypothetical protein Pmar_PMAR002447 [Perkinsus marinus ATCC 50983]|eukprot:XP_002765764.1 hypothetical protein Pmar_PMAR002447 [Perkinsus marinus ATCC 50983]